LTSTLSVPRSPASSMPFQRRAMPSQNSRSVLSEARSASLSRRWCHRRLTVA
jgi:hypothetical protein